MIYLRPTPPRDGALFFSAGLLAGFVGAVLATGDAFGLFAAVTPFAAVAARAAAAAGVLYVSNDVLREAADPCGGSLR